MATATLNYDLQKTIRLLPGYDPFAQAGDCWFDEEAAELVLNFVQTCCTHVKGDKARELLVLEPWQQAIYANLWGWKQPSGLRRYREALIFIPRGNSKTTMAAAMVNVGLFLDREGGAELYSGAAERKQARICLQIVQGMIRNESEMERRATVYANSVVVEDRKYEALSAEAGTKHGYNVQYFINDELHAQKTPEFTEVMMTGMGKRSEPMAIHLTTADYEREGSICNTKYFYAVKVRDNLITDPAFLPVIYEAGAKDEWTAPKTWAKANPNLGISVPKDYIRRECKRAQSDPTYENTFKRLHLNIRTQAAARWLTSQSWDDCQQEITLADYRGRECWGGLDVASSQDFNALVLAFPEADDMVAVFAHFWVPLDTACKREREHRIPYDMWSRAGLLTLTPESSINARMLGDGVMEIITANELHVRELAVDQAFHGLDVIDRLVKEEGLEAFAHSQRGMGMIQPTKQTKNLILGGKLKHDGNAVMRWMMGNVVVYPDESTERPLRDKSIDKIDGPVAMIMAVGRAVLNRNAERGHYETHEVRRV